MSKHFLHSSYREKLIEHLFIGELLKASWHDGDCLVEVARPEVDNRGYDLIAEHGDIVRHIQLKAAHRRARAASQKVHLTLADKPSGCVVWVYFDEETLELGPFLYFGSQAGLPMPSLDTYKVATHTKGNADGVKGERKGLRVVPKRAFRSVATAGEVYDLLFDPTAIYGDAYAEALDVFGTHEKALGWLTGQLPSLVTDKGLAEVKDLLDQFDNRLYT